MRPFYMLALLGLTSCQWLPGTDQHLIDQAQKEVADQLRDPSSAQFRRVKVVRQVDGRKVVCGELNGHNAYGGYAGFSKFIVDGDRAMLEPQDTVEPSLDELEASVQFLSAETDLCVLAGKTVEDVEAETARQRDQMMKRGGGA